MTARPRPDPAGTPRWRFGPWDGGPDPLTPPPALDAALGALAERILGGADPADALDGLRRQGLPGRPGLDELRARVDELRQRLTERGALDGVLRRAEELLELAVGRERAALAADPSDAARLEETALADLPTSPAAATRALAGHHWHDPGAAHAYQQLRDLLRDAVMSARPGGPPPALMGAMPHAPEQVRDFLHDVDDLLAADRRGEDTGDRLERLRERHGDLVPGNPRTVDELVGQLARRSVAASRLLASLPAEQRRQLADLLGQAARDLRLDGLLDRLGSELRRRRPDLPWGAPARDWSGTADSPQQLGMGAATALLEELADLEDLAAALDQTRPGATPADVDPGVLARLLGTDAADALTELRDLERRLEDAGYTERTHGRLRLTPKAVRRVGAAALQRVLGQMEQGRGRGRHPVPRSGHGGEPTGTSRPWQPGDESPLDAAATVRAALLRRGSASRSSPRRGAFAPLRLEPDDLRVAETERHTGAAVALLVDLSYSMVLREAWPAAKTAALALHTLVSTRFPHDQLELIGFASTARRLHPAELMELTPDTRQGTNLEHALALARQHLARHPRAQPVVLVVTDGEPTAHTGPDGHARFAWPPEPETLDRTQAQVRRLTRRGAVLSFFLLDDDPRLVGIADGFARANGGRVLLPGGHLGEHVVRDYLRLRRGRR